MVEEAGVMLDGNDEVAMTVRKENAPHHVLRQGAVSDTSRTCSPTPVQYAASRTKPCQFKASSSCAVGAGVTENLVQARLVARHQHEYGQTGVVTAVSNRDSFVDDLTGLPLPPELCRAVRQKEIAHFRAKGVWELRLVSDARAKMGRRPISVRWVETNKGDDENPQHP